MRKLLLIILLITAISAAAIARPDLVQSLWYMVRGIEEPILDRGPATMGLLSEYELNKLDAMTAQEQAAALLEYSIAGYDNAPDLVAERFDLFLEDAILDDALRGVVDRALQSTRLETRAAAMDVFLATMRAEKTSEKALRLLEELKKPDLPLSRRKGLGYTLAFLGGRGVERQAIFDMLVEHLDHPDDSVRFRTAVSMGFFGGREIIDPLLHTMATDPYIPTRERAACSLSSSGMLNVDERFLAAPGILDVIETTDDPQTKAWGYQALQFISGTNFPHNPAAWREGLDTLGILNSP